MTRGPSKTAEECAADWRDMYNAYQQYEASKNHDPVAAELYEVANPDREQNTQKQPEQAHENYVYPAGNPERDEARHATRISMSKSNQVMRKFLDDVALKVCEERQAEYDVPERNHARAAKLMATYLEADIEAEQVCLLNIAQKLSRCTHQITYDSLLDIAGYAANCAAILASRLPVNGT